MQTELLCWTKMQAEAGQAIEAIISRKECERAAGNGLFMWGVGNAPAVPIKALARLNLQIPVLFSLMKSKPKVGDRFPEVTLVWRRYIDHHGVERDLPENVLITSRGAAGGSKRRHYALMCFSQHPLHLTRGIGFDHRAYHNASGTGAPIAPSQVTALVKRVNSPEPTAEYEVNLQAHLIGSLWVRLSDPMVLDADQIQKVSCYNGTTTRAWLQFVSEIRGRRVAADTQHQYLLI